MAMTPLPKNLRARLAELGRRLRRQHLIEGCCRLVLVLAITACIAVAVDATLQLPGWSRGCLLVGWLLLGAFEIRRFIRGPGREALDPEGLAAAIEQEYPRLGERLTTAVELAGNNDPANGSPFLVELIVQEAEIRTRKLDLNRAAPIKSTLVFAAASVAAILVMLVPLVTVPKAAEHARRFFAPWYTPSAEVLYRIKVTSGDPTVKRGESTTLSALVEPTKPDALLPSSATAIIKTAGGSERIPMTFDVSKREAYLTRGPLDADFDYQIISGEAASEWRHVSVTDPVRVVSAHITITPPAYARKPDREPAPLEGLSDLAALQYSTITFDLRFNYAPSAAWLEWRPDTGEAGRVAPPTRINLTPNAESVTVTVVAVRSGEFRLCAESGKLKSSFRPMPLRVAIDGPPKFEQVSGIIAQPRSVRPGEKPVITCVVSDDQGLSRLGVEVRADGGPEQFVPITIPEGDSQRVSGTVVLDLPALAKDKNRIEYRLVALDNRSVPEAKLASQLSYYPESSRWAELQLSPTAPPLAQQEIVANKLAIEQRLKEVVESLKKQEQATSRLRTDNAKLNALKDEELEKLEQVQRDVQETADTLGQLARQIGVTPDLAPLSAGVRDVASQELRSADTALRQAKVADKAAPRTERFQSAETALQQATRKVEALLKENERLAQGRLDKQKLEDLAEQQKNLMDEAAKADESKLAELQAKQRELEERLRKLQDENEPFRQALQEIRAQQLEQAGKEVQELEQQVRDLTQAMKNTDNQSTQERFADLLKKQQELEKRAKRLATETDSASRTAPLTPLKPDEIAKAGEALRNGNLAEAVDQQEKAARELDRLADELEKAVARARDPREATRQLSRLQEDIRQKVADILGERKLPDVPKETLDTLRGSPRRQQDELRRAIEKLSIPPEAVEAEKTRREALGHARRASEAISEKFNGEQPDDNMQQARDALNRLVEQLPTQEKRLAQARAELAKLQPEQDALARLAEQTAKGLEKQDPDAAATQQEMARRSADLSQRQQQVAEKLSKLDAPGHEDRLAKAEKAIRQAKNDLDQGRSQDIGASQQTARRELERLEQALSGQTPADEQADRLAKKQKEIAAEMQRNAASPNADRTRELQQLQSALSKDLQKLQAPESPAEKDDALSLMRKAETAKSPESAATQAEAASKTLQRLADRLNGRDSEKDKADRLAKKQQQAAEEADRLAKDKEDTAEQRKKAQQRLDEARTLRPGEGGQKDKQRAIEALNRAQQSTQPDQLAKAEKDAAEALRRLSDRIQPTKDADQPMAKNDAGDRPQGLANKAQADEARRLAQEQRQLRNDLARANEQMGKEPKNLDQNPLEDLVKEQDKIAQAAGEMAKKSSGDGKQAQQAAEAAQQAAKQLKNGEMEKSRDFAKAAAQKLEQLAQDERADAPKKDAQELAKRQEALNRKLEEMAGDPRAARAQQAERQKELQQQIQQAAERMERTAQQMKKDGMNEQANQAGEAAMQTKQAEESLKNARDQNAKGQQAMSRESQDKAADALKQASQSLQNAAQQMAKKDGGKSDGAPPAGRSIEEARDRMERAQNDLRNGQPKDAGDSMKKAESALRQAAKQMGRPGNPMNARKSGDPTASNMNPMGPDSSDSTPLDLSALGPLADKYKGKAWGDLPGEIKNQIITDMKARYGEDYAKYIKLYFEQLAERK